MNIPHYGVTFEEKGHRFTLQDPQTYKCDYCDMEYRIFVDGSCNKHVAFGHTVKRDPPIGE